MRLINTSTLTLTEYPDSKLPEKGYAILSHRWLAASEEVTFEDLQQNREVLHKTGYAKLKGFCSVAASKGYEFAWCDTCCIGKASAVELGSAINSMYRWYKNAEVCIAYLQDVHEGGVAFQDSEWFCRGWTLQELIAPARLEFFDRDWTSLGTKTDNVEAISATTGIPITVLKDTDMLPRCSVAQRMSWAAHRTTERLEDQAYSLLGLFDVSLEMIYGEQEKAFIRLQEKIIQQSADQSVFAWTMGADKSDNKGYGLLATSPSRFRACGDVGKGTESVAFSMTNLGLIIAFKALPYDIDTYVALLDCSLDSDPTSTCGILLSRLNEGGQWARVSINGFSVVHKKRTLGDEAATIRIDVCVRQTPTSRPIRADQTYGFWLRTLAPPYHEETELRILSRTYSPRADHMLLHNGTFGMAGIISIKPEHMHDQWSRVRWIRVGFDDDFLPTIMLANPSSKVIEHFKAVKDFEEAERLGPTCSIHQELFNNRWLRTGKWTDDQDMPSIENAWAKGYYILKHTRDRWPDHRYDFAALNLSISFSLVPDLGLDTGPGPSKSIWAIDIRKMGDSDPERKRNNEKIAAWTMAVVGCPFLLCGWGAPYQTGQARIAQMSRSNYK